VNRFPAELLALPVRALRRATFWWSVGLAAMVALTMAFWPAFQNMRFMEQAVKMIPPSLAQAFGVSDLFSPAGYLKGNLYAILVPLLLVFAAVMSVNSLTAAEEAAGRLELYLAQPVDRRWLFAGRGVAAVIAVGCISLVVLVTQLISDAIVGITVEFGRLLSTVILGALLGLLHGAIGFAVAGLRARPSLVLATGTTVAIAGYLVSVLFVLSPDLAGWRHISPWDWALGGDPLLNDTEPWRYLVLLVPTLALGALGTWAFGRRDVAAA
jgi:ABC-2 type transport system permease protein